MCEIGAAGTIRRMRSSTRVLSLLAVLGLSACGGAPWEVIMQSGPPSALLSVNQLSIAVDSTQLMVNGKPVAEVNAEEDDFPGAVSGMEAAFGTAFQGYSGVPIVPAMGPPQPQEFRVTARFVEVDPGKYAFVYARDTVLVARVVFTFGMNVVDEIEVRTVVDASRRQPSIVQRMQIAGRITGERGAQYFRQARGGS